MANVNKQFFCIMLLFCVAIMVMPCLAMTIATAQLLVLTSPMDLQVIQREANNNGSVSIKFTSYPGGTTWQATFLDATNIAVYTTGRIPLPSASSSVVDYNASVPAGGWYRLLVEEFDSSNKIIANGVVERVGVGEIFITAGQSNSTSCGESPMPLTDDRVSVLAPDGSWKQAKDPQPSFTTFGQIGGSPWPGLGDILAKELGVPIAFVHTGVGGTGIRQWQKWAPPISYQERNLDIYNTLIQAINAIPGKRLRAILWHQGESNTLSNRAHGGPDVIDPDGYAALFGKLVSDVKHDTNIDVPWLVSNASYMATDYNDCTQTIQPLHFFPNAQVRWGQQKLWDNGVALPGPDTDDLYGPDNRYPGSNGMCTHFAVKGLQAESERWTQRILSTLPAGVAGQRVNCKLTVNSTTIPYGDQIVLKLSTDRIVSKASFDKTGLNTEILFNDLISGGYINKQGEIQTSFHALHTYSEMKLDSSYETKKAQIFDVLKKMECPLPPGAKGYWNGTRDGIIDAKDQPFDQSYLTQWSEINNGDKEPGIYTRNLTVKDASGKVFCQSNSVTYQLQDKTPFPAVTLTANGQKSLILKAGDTVDYEWHGSNGVSYGSAWTKMDSADQSWHACSFTPPNRSTGPGPLPPAGTYLISYWATDSKDGWAASSVLVTVTNEDPNWILGDVSENGFITMYDASLAARYAAGLINNLTDEEMKKADVSGNGNVTAYDAALIARYAAGLIRQFKKE